MLKTVDYTLWQDIEAAPPDTVSSAHWQWLKYSGSLTEQLQRRFGPRIEFRFINEGLDEISEDERLILDINDRDLHWVRRIEWRYQKELWIAARTVIPRKYLHPELKQMGNTSIGNYLFQSGKYQRDTLEIAKLLPDSRIHGWKRRSIFTAGNEKLLVSEMFFPAFFQHDFSGCK